MRTKTLLLLMSVVLAAPSALAQEAGPCPGTALPPKPGAVIAMETRFFAELNRLDGLLVGSEIVQGCVLEQRLRFEEKADQGPPRTWEAPIGEVVGLLSGNDPMVIMRSEGQIELRAGRLVTPLTVRLFLGELATIIMEPARVEFFLLRGVYERLPLPLMDRIAHEIIVPAFQQLRKNAELIATRGSGVVSGTVRTEEFPFRPDSGPLQRLARDQIRKLTVLAVTPGGVRVRVEPTAGPPVEGVLALERLAIRLFARDVQLPMMEISEIVFRDETLRYSGKGSARLVFCEDDPC